MPVVDSNITSTLTSTEISRALIVVDLSRRVLRSRQQLEALERELAQAIDDLRAA